MRIDSAKNINPNRKQYSLVLLAVIGLLFVSSCSNQKNTFVSRKYHSLTTQYNVYFNGKESFKEGELRMNEGFQENYTNLLPVFKYQNAEARALALPYMERVLDKATKAIKNHSITRKPKRKDNQSEAYKEFRKKNEFNPWIDDCYLLLGKAQFYKGEHRTAERIFDFMLSEYPESKLGDEVRLWKAISLADRGELIAGKEVLDRLSPVAKFSVENQVRVQALYADVLIQQGEFSQAVFPLERCISIAKDKKTKARYCYLLAQIYHEIENSEEAYRTLQKLIDLNADHEITFNAKIKQALSYTGTLMGKDTRSEVEKMLKNSKNKEYRDQLYYALAEMDVADGDMESAIANYWESTKVSTFNENQKAVSFLKLGDYYFGKEAFPQAQVCYDSSMMFLNKQYPNYFELSERIGDLSELLSHLNVVLREDSLQKIAAMPEKERDELINHLVAKAKKEEEIKKQQAREAREDRRFFVQNNLWNQSSQSLQRGGGWYFYNPTNIGLGKSEFQRKWGRRKLEDNWRRENHAILDFNDAEFAEEQSPEKKQKETKRKDPTKRETYLDEIPLNEKSMETSNKKIMEGLYQAALVYKEKLKNEEKALACLENLLERFPENPYLLSVYYYCYSICQSLNKTDKANFYKQQILQKFKNTQYANALSDPDYREKADAERQRNHQIYEQAYQKFQNYDYLNTIRLCEQALLKLSDKDLKPQVLFLKALSVGKTQNANLFAKALQEVLKSNPPKKIEQTCHAILSRLEQGAVPIVYTERDMEIARQRKMFRNQRIEEKQAIFENKEERKDQPKEQQQLYQHKDEEEHYFVLLFSKSEADHKRSLFHISNYNADVYNNRTFKVDLLDLDQNRAMLVVKNLKNKEDALQYFHKMISNEAAFRGLEKVDYRNFIISKTNFNIFRANQNVEQYLNFYTKSYFNIQRKAKNSTKPTKKSLPKSNSSTSFVFDATVEHSFVLLISKQNTKQLQDAISAHDVSRKAFQKPYSTDFQMLTVARLGSKTEAMQYFRNFVANDAVYQLLENIEYRNFIISDENLKLLTKNQNLEEYLQFFKNHYLE